MTPSAYQQEQREALEMVRRHLAEAAPGLPDAVAARLADYHAYRRRLDAFLDGHFREVCRASCYESRLSACCSREGIITFFADVVVNALASADADLDVLDGRLGQPNTGFKCIYLGPRGCLWRIRPLNCALFLCDAAERRILGPEPDLGRGWQALRDEAKCFRWPDRPVLFDDLEHWCMAAGYHSSLMYLNTSPGLLRVKRRAGLGFTGKTGP